MSISYDDRRVWQNIDTELKDSLILKLISSLECSICSEVMHVPFLASCGHSFCYGCLDAWFETKVNCPTCRKDMVEPPILNISLKETSKAITDLIIDTLEDKKYRAELQTSRAQLIEDYENANRSKVLFGKAFDSAPTLVDTSDGVPRCGNCHWEAHGSVCLNCGARFRHPRSDSYYDSEDGDAYNEDGEELDFDDLNASFDTYDSADSFVDNEDHDDGSGSQVSGDDENWADLEMMESYSENQEHQENQETQAQAELTRIADDSLGSDQESPREEAGEWRDIDTPWQGLSDDDGSDSWRHDLHSTTDGLLDELHEQHDSDVERFRRQRRRQRTVVDSDSE